MPRAKQVRPTREVVRKAIFDVLGDAIFEKEVLDLFSGSGALGFEALSRGAKSVIFVENKPECIMTIRENISLLGVREGCQVIPKDVFFALNLFINKKLKFQLILADPPYYRDLAKKCLLKISECDILDKNSFLILEHYKKDELPNVQNKLVLWQRKHYGDTFVSFYIK